MAASFGIYYNIIRRGYITWYNVRHIVACGFMMWTNITLRNKMALNKSVPSGSYCKQSFSFLLLEDRFSSASGPLTFHLARSVSSRTPSSSTPEAQKRDKERQTVRSKNLLEGGRCLSRKAGRGGTQLLSSACPVSELVLDISACISSLHPYNEPIELSRYPVAILQSNAET